MKTVLVNFICMLLILAPLSLEVKAIQFSNHESEQKFRLLKPSEYMFQSYANQELISIRLLGSVRNAGLYHVPKKFDLISLLALAGGTTKEANLDDIQIGNDGIHGHHKIDIKLSESLGARNQPRYLLKQNDIVLVSPKKSIISNDTWKIVSTLSAILTAGLTAIIINEKLND